MDHRPIVIVGTGLGGYSLAREFRKLDGETPVLILTADDGRYYSKPILSNAYTSGKTPDTIALADAAAMASQLKATVRTGTRVTAIEPDRETLRIEGKGIEGKGIDGEGIGGEPIAYRGLVLALGADPIHIPVAGSAADRVLSVNDLGDYTAFRAAMGAARRIAVMGAGLIGSEFANDLTHGGIAVSVIEPASWPLSRFVPEPVGRALERALATLGVHWSLGRVVQSLDDEDGTVRVTLSDGTRFSADGVLSAVGLRPRTALAAGTGLRIGRGIVVDRQLETSVPGIYALGDCAEVEGLVLPFVMPIMHAARALAKTLAGQPTRVAYPAMPILVKTTAFPVVVAPPATGVPGEWEIEVQPAGARGLYRGPDGRLLGFALAGEAVADKNVLTRALPPVLS
ncbi:MAG: NAD(P)/FAD-dependent oxidoreductase [Gammaproteobacteria bacterium]